MTLAVLISSLNDLQSPCSVQSEPLFHEPIETAPSPFPSPPQGGEWPEGLAHYVECHSVRLPDEFIETMRSHSWHVPAKIKFLQAAKRPILRKIGYLQVSILTPVRYLDSFLGPVGQKSADQQTQAPGKTEENAQETTVAFGLREVT